MNVRWTLCLSMMMLAWGVDSFAMSQAPSRGLEAALTSATGLIDKGEFVAAVGALRPWLQSHGNSGRLHALLGTALCRSGQLDEGIRHLERAFNLNQRDPALFPELIDAHLQLEHKPQVEAWLEKLAQLPDVPLEIHRSVASICVRGGSTDLAVRHLEKIRARYRQSLILADLASAYFLLGNYAKVSATLEAYARNEPLPAPLLSLRGMAALKLGQRAQATEFFRQAIKLNPKEGSANFYLGTLAAEAGQIKDAIRHLELAAQSYRDRYAANYNLALVLYKAERWQEGIAVLEKLLANEHSSSAEIHNLLGQGYDRLDRVKEAVDAYQKAMRLDPGKPAYVLDLGLMALRRRTYELAEIVFSSGVKTFPQDRNLGLALGTTLQLRGQMARAQQTFRDLLGRNPQDAVVYLYLGKSCFEAGQLDDAVEAFSRGITLDPKNSLFYYHAAVSLIKAGRLDDPKVASFLAKALELDPKLAPAEYQLAKLAADGNDFAAARVRLDRALQLDPEMSEAHFLLARVCRQSGDKACASAALKRYEDLRVRERERLENDRVLGLIYSLGK